MSLGASIILLTMLSYWFCPGHRYLFHDSLVYVPMLERLFDPTVLKADLLARRPHLAFTIYSEVAVGLRRLTGLGFREILTSQQWIFRALEIFAVYLIARALKLSERLALWVAAIFALGATTVGAYFATMVLEPVPTSVAFPLVLLALGLTAHRRYVAAGVAGSLGFLYHPPIGYPFWAVYSVLALWPCKQFFTKKRLFAFLPLVGAGILLFILSRQQVGAGGQDSFFSRLDPLQEQLQLSLASYVWVSLWPFRLVEHHLFLWVVSGLAFWRLRESVDFDLRFFLIGLPLVGILSMPASYVLLEKMKWTFIPQFQPMRALAYLAVVAGITTAAAGIKAVEQRHYLEGFFWLAVAFAIPTESRVLHIVAPRLSSLAIPLVRRRVISVVVLALSACLTIWSETHRKRWASLALGTVMCIPFFLLPYTCKVNQFPRRDSPELSQLANWARASTSKDAMFLFPDAGLEADPSVFRATALRSVYVDWKSNGQINFSREFTEEWWSRSWKVMALKYDSKNFGTYAALGIDYLVVRPVHRDPGATPVFENSRFVVYRVQRGE